MLAEFPAAKIKAVFSDLDDTLTDHSQMLPSTYELLEQLKRAGKWLVIVSGRPAGWADCLMRLWPIDAMVFENGAGVMVRDGKKIITTCLANTHSVAEQKTILESSFLRLQKKIPHLKLATDQGFRRFDYAIDFAEEPPFLSDAELNFVLRELEATPEITHKLSSIHVNYWVGYHTKVTACVYLLQTQGTTRGVTKDNVVYCGDSPNDESLFAYFPESVGVANVRKYLPLMKALPKYITQNEGGRGFQEVAKSLLSPAG